MKRIAFSLVAATAMMAGVSPALAQDGYTLPPPPPIDPQTYEQAPYQQAPAAMPVQTYGDAGVPAPQVQYQQTGPLRHYGYGEAQYAPPPAQYPAVQGLPPVPSVGYTRDQREAWLADCRQQYYGPKKKNGGIIGGLLGMVGGGIAGHELTDGPRTRRIGGTLIGAGVGGLVGAAIGSAIGAAADREDMDECEAYLSHYTGGYGLGPMPAAPAYGPGYGYGYGYGGYVTIMVPVPMQPTYIYTAPTRHETRYVTEEVVEERIAAPRTKYVRTIQPTKYIKAKPAAKYTK
ncbi:hypothetical protein [Croceibacterium aestuarii]|uniref:hypothetical protein n=1 Tax=Croceibacterium aestuarii TaxID=3064139 RepID=UPI00272EBDAD|nr:hypothetical protein [Croceibacterium sp. D39]